jgi:hypothetical protein
MENYPNWGSGVTRIATQSLATAALIATLLLVNCAPPPPAPPPFPALPQNCIATDKPDVVVPPGKGVRIFVGRRGYEPSLISIGVRIDDKIREDGRVYPPGPDANLYPYRTNNPIYFRSRDPGDQPRHVTASMVWSANGTVYDQPSIYTTLCLLVNGARISFYTARRPEPNTVVDFEFYSERPPPVRKPRRSPRNKKEAPAAVEPSAAPSAPSLGAPSETPPPAPEPAAPPSPGR